MAKKIENMSDAAVRKATGRDWAEWRRHLDSAGARDWSHKQIVAHLGATEDMSGWWQQSVTVGYEKMHGRRIVGQTAEAGFQVGVQRTLPLSTDAAWRMITSDDGIRTWLGEIETVALEPGARFRTDGGTQGEFRVVKPNDRIRMTWQPMNADPSTVQIALSPAGDGKTAVRFHHERLGSAKQREQMRRHWRDVLDGWTARIQANANSC